MRYYIATTSAQSVPPQTTLGAVTDDARALSVPAIPATPEATAQLVEFCDPRLYGEPEVWSYEAARDGVICTSLLGRAVTCHDLQAWAADCGNPTLPAMPSDPNNALLMANWTMNVYFFLSRYAPPPEEPPVSVPNVKDQDPPSPSGRGQARRGDK